MDRILLVTGASSDVGIELLKSISGDYAKMFLQYRTMNEGLEDAMRLCGASADVIPIQADFSDTEQLGQMIATIKDSGDMPNSIVHLPAPKAYNQRFHKDDWGNFEAGWEISVRSIVEILQAFIAPMAKARYGRIVFMLTSYTEHMPPKYQSGYVTVKYALLGLMRSLAVEYADKGITVNGVSPDMMDTRFLSDLPELIVEGNRRNSPLGRNVRIGEVVPLIRYFLSDAGAAATGQNIAVTGGL